MMGKRILIIYPCVGARIGNPAGSDVHVLANYLVEKFHVNVDVLSSTREYNEYKKYNYIFVPTYEFLYSGYVTRFLDEQNFLKKLFNRVLLKLAHYKYEGSSFARNIMSIEHLKKWIKHDKRKNYDLMISISNPFYSHKYAKYTMDNMNIKKWCAVFLDPHSDNLTYHSSIEKRIREENEIFENCTSIFACNEFMNNSVYSNVKKYKEKVSVVPVHIIDDNCLGSDTIKRDNSDIKCVFAGRFYDDIRHPELLFKYFEKLPSHYYLFLYSRGCKDIIDKYKQILGKRLIVNDFIGDPIEYDTMIRNMDICIDLGNTIENQVPSKVFDYASYGVPILHFKNCKNDPVEILFSKYPLFASVPYVNDYEKAVNEIMNFCNRAKGKTIPWGVVKSLLKNYTVEYVAEKIISMID